MANIINRGTMLPPEMVSEIFNGVRGDSAIARLAPEAPIPFNGSAEMVFTMDSEASIVGESEAKVNGGATAIVKVIRPYKFEYGFRTSDEFIWGTEEYRMNVLRTFAEGARRKFARGFDIAAFHGFNPKAGTASTVVGDNHIDHDVTQTVTYAAATADTNIVDAVALVEASGAMVNGIAMSPAMKSAIGAMTVSGAMKYPQFAFGATPEDLGGTRLAVNPTVAVGTVDHAIVGDWSAFRWGYGKDITVDVIEYGNPDNDAQAGDLKGHNQVYLRAEAYIGWAVLAPSFFARVKVGA